MKKQKTRKELETNNRLGIVFILLLLLVVTFVSFYGVYLEKKVEYLETQLSECQDEIGVLENVQLTPTTISYWQKSWGGYNNYVCVGSFYINENKFEIPEGLGRAEIPYLKGEWIWNRTK